MRERATRRSSSYQETGPSYQRKSNTFDFRWPDDPVKRLASATGSATVETSAVESAARDDYPVSCEAVRRKPGDAHDHREGHDDREAALAADGAAHWCFGSMPGQQQIRWPRFGAGIL